uniref:Uncharacterized protein n=1 Tax=Arundo donax TaxID=35708 RepID=A0A0A9BWC5_ARUDO
MLDITQKRRIVTFKLAICSMVSYLSYPLPWKPEGDFCMFSYLSFYFIGVSREGSDSGRTVALSPFGLATYRMEGDLWSHAGSSSNNRLYELYWAASSWLKQVRAHHPDFNFFTSHRSTIR